MVPLLELMTEPAAAAVGDAPIDNEPVTEEEERAVAASKEGFPRIHTVRNRKEAYR